MTDAELLDSYRNDRSTTAFDEVVRRHIDLVYSIARRQVRSSHLAEEVTQTVFVELARCAPRLRAATPLVAWLHVVSRRTAIDIVRHESRRRTREHVAAELETMDAPTPRSDWQELEPLLDEAIASLHERDRAAVLLRYFENKSLRDVGAAIGASDDAAQKCVTRALEKLRAFFMRRGVSVTSAGLLTQLSAHAMQRAPSGLNQTISAATALSLSTLPALTMTTVQKLLVAAALTVATTGGVYQAWVIAQQRDSLRIFRQRAEDDRHALGTLRRERDDFAQRVAGLSERLNAAQSALAAVPAPADPAIEEALDSWLQRVVQLKQHLEQKPNLRIPELQLLEAKDWLDATKETTLETDMDFRAALSTLRQVAKHRLFAQLTPALHRFCRKNNGQAPVDVAAQLAPYFDQPINLAMLQRYAVVFASEAGMDWPKPYATSEGKVVEWLLREKQSVDDYFDSIFWAFDSGYGFTPLSKFGQEVNDAIGSFSARHGGAKPTEAAQLAPYLKTAIDPAFIQRRLAQNN